MRGRMRVCGQRAGQTHFWRAVTGALGGAAVQLSRRARQRKPGRATQWMSTDTEAEKVDSSVATPRCGPQEGEMRTVLALLVLRTD